MAPTVAGEPAGRACAPLADVRVLAVEQHGAGPFSTLQLADLGAEVIKIERPEDGGDIARAIPPYAVGGDSLFFQSLNRGKRSVALDLSDPVGYEAFLRLAAGSDVVVANVRGDVPDRLGIRYERLKTVNRALVCCFITGFGMTGLARAEPAYDPVIQALTGWMSLTGAPAGPPTRTGLSLVDFCAGYQCALAVLAAVHAARRDGVGCECDISMFDVGISLLTYLATWQLSRDHTPVRQERSAHASIVPFQLFTASDGWIVIGAVRERHWQRLTSTLGRPDLADDPRFATPQLRLAHRAALQDELDRVLSTRTVAQWYTALRSCGVACAPVRTIAEALADPLVRQRGLLVEYSHPELGQVRTIGPVLRLGDHRPEPGPAPRLGEHTEEVLARVGGLSAAELDRVRASGVSRSPRAVV